MHNGRLTWEVFAECLFGRKLAPCNVYMLLITIVACAINKQTQRSYQTNICTYLYLRFLSTITNVEKCMG